jgi:hypothetical protein
MVGLFTTHTYIGKVLLPFTPAASSTRIESP